MTAICQCAAQFAGRQSHCTVCHLTFASDTAGDGHRTGRFDPPDDRRCRTTDELVAGGMWERPGIGGTPVWHGVFNHAGRQRRRTPPNPRVGATVDGR